MTCCDRTQHLIERATVVALGQRRQDDRTVREHLQDASWWAHDHLTRLEWDSFLSPADRQRDPAPQNVHQQAALATEVLTHHYCYWQVLGQVTQGDRQRLQAASRCDQRDEVERCLLGHSTPPCSTPTVHLVDRGFLVGGHGTWCYALLMARASPTSMRVASVSALIQSLCPNRSPPSGRVSTIRSVSSRPASFRMVLTVWMSS
jgi:hypothetical protein